MKYPLAVVEWEDAAHEFGWQEGVIPEPKTVIVRSVGYVIKRTKKHILLAQSIAEDNHAQTLQIPKGMVIKVKNIKEP